MFDVPQWICAQLRQLAQRHNFHRPGFEPEATKGSDESLESQGCWAPHGNPLQYQMVKWMAKDDPNFTTEIEIGQDFFLGVANPSFSEPRFLKEH